VIEFAARLLPFIAAGIEAPEPVRENLGRLDLLPTGDVVTALLAEVRRVLAEPGSVGVVVADADVEDVSQALGVGHVVLGRDDDGSEQPDRRVTLVPASLAKGLEYDHVVVVEPAAIVAGEPSEFQGLRRLYVVLTRAVSGLSVVHARPLPEELAA
jgi:hypothetical protein